MILKQARIVGDGEAVRVRETDFYEVDERIDGERGQYQHGRRDPDEAGRDAARHLFRSRMAAISRLACCIAASGVAPPEFACERLTPKAFSISFHWVVRGRGRAASSAANWAGKARNFFIKSG